MKASHWAIIAATVGAALLAWALSTLQGCAPDAAATVKAPLNVLPTAAPSTAVTGNGDVTSIENRLEALTEQVNEAIAAAQAAQTVNGNMIQNQGITNAQYFFNACFFFAVCCVLIGVFAPVTVKESVILYAVALFVFLAGAQVMQGGKLPAWAW
jgi:hypothetical protein